MKKRGLINSNTGMTLVELLVALGIFVAAIIPMLYAFVYSTGFNFKAQQTMQSTGIAQAIIEKCKGSNTDYKSISDLLVDGHILIDNNRFTLGGYTHPATDEYHFNDVKALTFSGGAVSDTVDNGSTTRRAYDVVVKLQAADDGAGHESRTDYSSMVSMHSGVTGNFCNADTLFAQDAVAQDEVLDKLYTDVIENGTVTITPANPAMSTDGTDYFTRDDIEIKKLHIMRLMSVLAEDDGVRFAVEYFYSGYEDISGHPHSTIELTTSAVQGGTTYTVKCTATPSTSASIYKAALGYTDDWLVGGPSTPVVSPACYIYYYPSYDYTLCPTSTQSTTVAKFEDNILVENDMASSYVLDGNPIGKFECYFFKQYNADLDNASLNPGIDLETLDDHYSPIIDIDGAGVIYTDVYHNFLWNVKTGDSMSGPTVNANFSAGCYDMTYVERSIHTNAGPNPSSDLVAEDYATYFCQTSPNGESPILRDRACLPAYSQFRDEGSYIAMFSPRIKITVEVYARNDTHSHSGETPIETMEAEFVNW